MLVGVPRDVPGNSEDGEREYESIQIIGLPHRDDQPLHTSMIRFLKPPWLHEKQDHLVQLQHGLSGALEPPVLRPSLPVDARDAQILLLGVIRSCRRPRQHRVQERGALAALLDEPPPLRRVEEPAFQAALKIDSTERAVTAPRVQRHDRETDLALGIQALYARPALKRAVPVFFSVAKTGWPGGAHSKGEGEG